MQPAEIRALVAEARNSLLLVVFVCFKLSGLLAWSWWLVTAPFWVPRAADFLLALVRYVLHRLQRPLA